MKTINKTQQGFTLVELIIVIVILGILAVTAAPRFLNFQGDAKESVLEGIAGSLKSGVKIVEGKAIIAGLNTAALACFDKAKNAVVAATAPNGGGAATCSGTDQVSITYGSPARNEASIRAVADFSGDIAVVLESVTTGTATKVFIANNAADAAAATASATTGCFVSYAPATMNGSVITPADVKVVGGNCN